MTTLFYTNFFCQKSLCESGKFSNYFFEKFFNSYKLGFLFSASKLFSNSAIFAKVLSFFLQSMELQFK